MKIYGELAELVEGTFLLRKHAGQNLHQEFESLAHRQIMIDDIFVFDDVISKDRQDEIESLMLGPGINWQFIPDVALPISELKNSNKVPTPAMAVSFNDHKLKYFNQKLYTPTCGIAFSAASKINFQINDIINSRSFLQFPLNDNIKKPYNNIHIDQTFEHLSCVYYVNDADGDTVIFDGLYNKDEYLTEAKIIKRVAPKKGRCVIFNGLRYHASSSPSTGVRCIINFNII